MLAPRRLPQHRRTAALRRTSAGWAAAALGAGLLTSWTAAASPAVAAPDFETPFACGEQWEAGTRSGHSPSYWSVDFNAYDDFGHPVLASTPGVVTSAVDLGSTSYGRYIVVDHGNGWTTLYAHLERMLVTEGEWVDQGRIIGLLGTTGGSTGPHLHFEERLDRTNQPAVFHDQLLDYNTTIRSRSCPDVPVSGDWNANGKSDVAVWRRSADKGVFYLRQRGGVAEKIVWGQSIDEPVSGDWNGNGTTDVGVWQRLTSSFLLKVGSRSRVVDLGRRASTPVSGDWDGDGKDDVGVYNARRGTFALLSAGERTAVDFGSDGLLPVTGDWNGNGTTDVGVYDPADGSWQLRAANGTVTTSSFGSQDELPVTGDWNDDGVTDLGTWSTVTSLFARQGRAKTVDWGRGRG